VSNNSPPAAFSAMGCEW